MPNRTYPVVRKKPVAKRKVSKLPKPRLWAKSRAVTEFSLWIRARDGKCVYPGCEATEGLQNSHYIGRAINATTYDPDNCVALCKHHHYGSKLLGYEYQKQRKELHGYDGQYTLFMKRRLGEKKFNELCARGKTSVNGKSAIIACMSLIQ